eukprot:4199479-Pyramimonas_sp.AAC.1
MGDVRHQAQHLQESPALRTADGLAPPRQRAKHRPDGHVVVDQLHHGPAAAAKLRLRGVEARPVVVGYRAA